MVTAPRRGRSALATAWLAAVLLLGSGQGSLSADTALSHEYQIKAAFLFNFAGFVGWPASAFPQAGAPLVIGVLGEDPFDGLLDETVHGENVNGRSLVVQRYHTPAEIQSCQILYISASEAGRLPAILESLKGRGILTVSDAADFAQRGGMIQMATENNKIRLKINLDSAKAAGLSLSSRLLRPAEIVRGKT